MKNRLTNMSRKEAVKLVGEGKVTYIGMGIPKDCPTFEEQVEINNAQLKIKLKLEQ